MTENGGGTTWSVGGADEGELTDGGGHKPARPAFLNLEKVNIIFIMVSRFMSIHKTQRNS